MKIATFAERLAEIMRIRDVSLTELHNRTGINKSSISTYLKGGYEAKQNKVYEIARALNVSEAWLMGYDIPMERDPAPVSSERDEYILISKYRKLSPEGKMYIQDQLDFRLGKEAASVKRDTGIA